MRPAAPVPHVTHPTVCPEPRGRVRRFLHHVTAALLVPVLFVAGLAAAFGAMLSLRPGVTVELGVRPGPGSLMTAPEASLFIVGLTERGPGNTVGLVEGFTEFRGRYGGFVSYGYVSDQVAAYFGEGGVRAYVYRLIGAGATKGFLNLLDRAGAPVNTLKVEAKDAGAWSTDVEVQIEDGAGADTFNVVIWYGGELVEKYAELTSPAAAVAAFAARPSAHVNMIDLASPTVAPNNNPGVLARTPLSAGADDRASLNAASYTGALTAFTLDLGGGLVAIPGQTSAAVGSALMTHCNTMFRNGALGVGAASTEASAIAEAVALRGLTGSHTTGIYGPWVKVPDGAGGERTVPPEGYIAGVRGRAHKEVGPWRSYAGDLAAARYITGVEREVGEDEGSRLNERHVNVIRRIGGNAVTGGGQLENYGARSLSNDTLNFRLLKGSETMHAVAHRIRVAFRPYTFGDVDDQGVFFDKLETEVINICKPMRVGGGLYGRRAADGTEVDPGYLIDTGPSVNTIERLQDDEVMADVAIRVSPTAEHIRGRVTKVGFAFPLAA